MLKFLLLLLPIHSSQDLENGVRLITIDEDSHESDFSSSSSDSSIEIKSKHFLSVERAVAGENFTRKIIAKGFPIYLVILVAAAEFTTDFKLPGYPEGNYVSLYKLFVEGVSSKEQQAIASLSGTLANRCMKPFSLILFGSYAVYGLRSTLLLSELAESKTLAAVWQFFLTFAFSAMGMLLILDNVRLNEFHAVVANFVFSSFFFSAIARRFVQTGIDRLDQNRCWNLSLVIFAIYLVCVSGQIALGQPKPVREKFVSWPFWLKDGKAEGSYLPYMFIEMFATWRLLKSNYDVNQAITLEDVQDTAVEVLDKKRYMAMMSAPVVAVIFAIFLASSKGMSPI